MINSNDGVRMVGWAMNVPSINGSLEVQLCPQNSDHIALRILFDGSMFREVVLSAREWLGMIDFVHSSYPLMRRDVENKRIKDLVCLLHDARFILKQMDDSRFDLSQRAFFAAWMERSQRALMEINLQAEAAANSSEGQKS